MRRFCLLRSQNSHEPKVGWQQRAVQSLHQKFHKENHWPRLTDAERALMHSQHGPLASAHFVPTIRMTRFEAQPFRVLLCRRFHLPLPLSSRTCRCGRQLDSFGHHRAACAEAGVLGKRGFPLECAAAQVCREVGARVTTNAFIRDHLGEFDRLDGRRIEVIADGLVLGQGAQLAMDTTLVSPLHRDGSARRGAATRPGMALEQARRRKEATYPELVGDDGPARLVVLAAETWRWSDETAHFLRGLAKGKAETAPLLMQNRVKAAWLRRWSCMLACSAMRALAMSLLEQRPNPGTGGLSVRWCAMPVLVEPGACCVRRFLSDSFHHLSFDFFKPSEKETGRWSFVLGNCSVCCHSGCFSDRRARVVSARLSCAIVSTSLEMVSGAHSTKQHVNKHPSRIPSDRTAQNRTWWRGLAQHCRKSSWVKCLVLDNVSLEQRSHRAQRPLSWRCRANDRIPRDPTSCVGL